ncbi:oligosaccharide flippase family protein [Flavobacterium antarcticum]|uniref:oligosaccharide flippase family protein n=1 Tax=Flavobacterium antarcticum TaxID=271155 RepID=UPI000A05C766|nr:oligosaccharide flippase family protein [Flavobacterium antarcticum]
MKTTDSHKTILKATGVFGFSHALKILVGLVGSKFVALFLGTAGIGTVGLLQNTLAIISSITGFGINISGVRMVALADAEQDRALFSKTVVVLKRWSIATGLLGVLVTFILAKPLSIWTFGSTEYVNWFLVLSINFIFSGLAVNKMVLLQGTRSMKAIAVSTVVYAVLVTLTTIPIYYFFRMDGIIPVLVITSVLNYVVNWFFARKIEILPVQVSIKETFSRGKEMIQLGFLLSINVIFGHIMSYLLKLYFNFQTESTSVLGLYVVASTLLITYVGMIFNAMSTDFYPRLTAVQKDNSQVKEMVNDQIEIGLLLITPLILGFYFLAPIVIRVLYSKDFIDVVLILKFALLAIIIKAIIWPLSFIILAKGEKKLYFKQEIFSDAMNIGFTILLYQYVGLIGIGIAMLLNYAVYGVYVFNVVKNNFQFNFRENTIAIIIKSLILGSLAALTVAVIDYPNGYWILAILLLLSVYFSYVELNKRVDLAGFLMKIKNKFSRN